MNNKYTFINKKEIPLRERTSHYVQKPWEYEVKCDKCGGSNIEWSEWDHMIWCYDCKIDTPGDKGVFDGPIPIEAAGLLGMSFDKYDMVNKRIVKFEDPEWKKI